MNLVFRVKCHCTEIIRPTDTPLNAYKQRAFKHRRRALIGGGGVVQYSHPVPQIFIKIV